MKKKITLGVFVDDPNNAVSWYRSIGPLTHLKRNSKLFDLELLFLEENSWPNLYACDAIFISRPHMRHHVDTILTALKLNKPVWIDFDDDLTQVPTDNPTHHIYVDQEIQGNIELSKRLATVVTVSTAGVIDRSDQDGNYIIIPNAVDETVFRAISARPRSGKILWRGSQTHSNDLLAHREVFDMIANETRYKLTFFGCNPWLVTSGLKKESFEWLPYAGILDYFRKTNEIAPQFFYIPLAHNAFNLSKSNIAWLEATLMGAACIAPSGMPEWDKPGVLALADRPIVLKDFLDRDEDSLKKVASECVSTSWNYIRENLSLSRVNLLRERVLSEMLS